MPKLTLDCRLTLDTERNQLTIESLDGQVSNTEKIGTRYSWQTSHLIRSHPDFQEVFHQLRERFWALTLQELARLTKGVLELAYTKVTGCDLWADYLSYSSTPSRVAKNVAPETFEARKAFVRAHRRDKVGIMAKNQKTLDSTLRLDLLAQAEQLVKAMS